MRFLIITLTLITLAGCSRTAQKPVVAPIDPSTPKMTDTVLKPNQTWLDKFGESDNTTIFYNLAVYKEIINQFNARINGLEQKTQYLPAPDPVPVQKVE